MTSCRATVRKKLTSLDATVVNPKPLDAVIRSQVISLYRYGERSTCGPKMEEFKFCMSLKSMHPEERREAWIRRRAEWWANRRLAKSSETVWDMRGCADSRLTFH